MVDLMVGKGNSKDSGKEILYFLIAGIICYFLTILLLYALRGSKQNYLDSPMWFLLPIGGIFLTFWLIDFLNDFVGTKFFSSVYGFALYVVLLFIGYYSALRRYVGNQASLNGLDPKQFPSVFAQQILGYNQPSALALISALFRHIASSPYFGFFLGCILGFFAYWAVRFSFDKKLDVLEV
jgi:uncharacterized membrane protein SpoIIM required for sporulation